METCTLTQKSNRIQVINEDDQIKLQIEEFEAKKDMILSSDMPSFLSDSSIF